jgi:hypothetical protein
MEPVERRLLLLRRQHFFMQRGDLWKTDARGLSFLTVEPVAIATSTSSAGCGHDSAAPAASA